MSTSKSRSAKTTNKSAAKKYKDFLKILQKNVNIEINE